MNREVIKRLIREIAENRWLCIVSVVLAIVSCGFQLYLPVLFGKAIDTIIADGNVDFAALFPLLKQAAVCTCLSAIALVLMTLANNRIAYQTVASVRNKAMKAVQNLPLSYLDQHKTGDMTARIIADGDAICDGLVLGISQLITGVVTIVLTLGFMFVTSGLIMLAVVVFTPVSFLVARYISSHTYTLFKAQSKDRGRQTGHVEEMITGMLEVRAFGYEDSAKQAFHTINEDLRNTSTKAVFYSSLTNPCTRCVNSIVYAIVALLGALFILQGTLTTGGLTILLNYASQYMKPFNEITSVITELQNAIACAQRLFDLIDYPKEADPVLSETKKPDLVNVQGSIDMEHVCFSYDASRPFIEDFNLHVAPGMHVALVGPTGCGKTTIINLLMRFYEISSGRICVDGTDITSISRTSLRNSCGMVLQDTWLSDGTIRDNLKIGKPDATDEEIMEACRKTQCMEWIEQMESGLDTKIRLDNLSDGQKQLLCITRVMLSQPSILILDEATSSIDTRTEILVQRAFDALMEGRTSLVVAHRLSTIVNADLILVMKDGSIIESGNHKQLLENNGFYAKLFNSQFASSSI